MSDTTDYLAEQAMIPWDGYGLDPEEEANHAAAQVFEGIEFDMPVRQRDDSGVEGIILGDCE